MGTGDPIVGTCASCGPVTVDRTLVEIHRDVEHRFSLVTFLCLGCGDLVASRCPTVLEQLHGGGPAEHRLVCTSTPAVPDAETPPTPA